MEKYFLTQLKKTIYKSFPAQSKKKSACTALRCRDWTSGQSAKRYFERMLQRQLPVKEKVDCSLTIYYHEEEYSGSKTDHVTESNW